MADETNDKKDDKKDAVDKAERAPRRIEPPVTELTQPFWDATRDRRLLLQWCVDCDTAQYFPREICLACAGSNLEWREASQPDLATWLRARGGKLATELRE